MTSAQVTISYQRAIPIFHFANNSRSACDEYVALFGVELQRNYYQADNPKPHYPVVLDISQSGMFSIKYMSDKLSQAHTNLQNPPEMIIAYIAHDLKDKTILSLVEHMRISSVSLKRKLFLDTQLEDALDWLEEFNKQ